MAMRRDYGTMGNRLAPQRDEMDARKDMEEERRRARQQAMLSRLSMGSGGKY
jgi:hypothetical protein